MKRFFRTIAGKTTAFLICFISVCILMGSILSAAFMIGYDFYTQDKEKVYEQFVSDRLHNDLYDDVWTAAGRNADGIIPLEDDGLICQILDPEGQVIAQSEGADRMSNWEHSLVYGVLRDAEGNVTDIYHAHLTDDNNAQYYIANASLDRAEGKLNFYTFVHDVLDRIYPLKYVIYLFSILSFILLIASFVTLMSVAGRRNEEEELHPGPLNRVPFDILAGLYLFLFAMFGYAFDSAFVLNLHDAAAVVILILGMILFWNLFVGLCMSMAVRIKQRNLIRGSFLYFCANILWKLLKYIWEKTGQFFRFVGYLLSNIPLVWKTLILIAVICIFELIFFFNSYEQDLFWVLEKLILIPAVIYLAIALRTLQKGGMALAEGDLSHHTDTKYLVFDLKKHGENLNDISKGMNLAIEKQMKSERMKTELITNVSHDIKTPLTSIINYADLIGKEKTSNKKITEYAEVLTRQSEKLKRLIEDLVEASKASTGNLEVELAICDAAVFVNQASGEYQNRMKESSLTLLTSVPEEELHIMADSRRMWRIFDNLMNNICKYAQPDTRVYLSLEKEEDKAVFTFRNTSREQLNISEEELMERFTRGDASRNTEGNGLGLSIARSMAQLQNGDLKISIDGDLFKAQLSFPLI